MGTLIEPSADPAEYFPFLKEHPGYDSTTKAENLDRLIAARDAGELMVASAPAYIRFEPSAHCNLRCCWAHRRPKHPALRPRGNASPKLAARVVGQVGDCLYQAILCHWGEPTLNPQLPEIIQVFHQAQIYTTFDTNMILMTEDLAARLIDAGLDAVSASIDGVSQAAYGQYRVGGRVADALAGLRHVVEQRRHSGRRNPRVRWQFLVFPHNAHEVDEAARLAADIGVDVFDALPAGGRRWTPEAGFIPYEKPRRPEGLLCRDPWTYLAVDWDGAVHLCCRAFQARHVAGHMDTQTLREVFDGEKFQLARRVIRDGIWNEHDGPTPCTGCNKVKLFTPGIAALGHVLTVENE